MEQSKNLSMCFKVNKDMLNLELEPSEVELYNKLMNDDTYSIQYIKLLIKNGLFILNEKNGQIQEIFRVIGDEEQLIFHANIHSGNQDQLSENKENEAEPMCDLQEYDQNESQEHNKKEKSIDYWNDSTTSFVLDKYKTYMSNIGPMKKFKTKKSMWAQIAKDMMMLNVSKTPLQMENRYKTILKRKKKAVENNSKSGSSREDIPYEKELRKIAHSDDSIEPEVLRSARSVKYPKLNTKMSEEIRNDDDDVSTYSNTDSSPKKKKSSIDKRIEYFEKKEAAKERRHQEKLNLIRELFIKQ